MENSASTVAPFAGYGQPTFTAVPDYFLDHQMHRLTGNAVKVMLYIFRHTYGYRKYCDAISYRQFVTGIVRADGQVIDQGAGISERGLAAALDELEERGLIFRHMEFTTAGGKASTVYEVNIDGQAHYKPAMIIESRPADLLLIGKDPAKPRQKMPYPPAKIADTPPAKIADTPPAKIADTKYNRINKQLNNTQGSAGRPAAGSDVIVIDSLKKAGISQENALQLVTAAAKNGHDTGYVAQLVDYVVGQTRIVNKAGYITRLIYSGADLPGWLQTALEGRSGPKRAKNPIDFTKFEKGGTYGFLVESNNPPE